MKMLSFILSILGIGAIMLIVAIVIFLIYRAIKIASIRNQHKILSEQGIDEEIDLQIGGIPQHLYIRGKDTHNPVILFLHGGPGGSMISMLQTYQYLWEDSYTVVNWDQRACGKTYFLNKENIQGIINELSVEVMLEDVHEIVLYLKERFNKEKVIIMCHSWGTVLGSQFALKYPELVEAYVGVGQAVDINEGILKMGEYTYQIASQKNNQKDMAKLTQIMDRIRNSNALAEAEVFDICKIAKRHYPVNMDTTIFLRAGLVSPYFSLREMSYYFKMDELTKPLNHYLVDYDLRKIGNQYEVPAIIVTGEYDWHMKLLAEEYFNTITAPYKEFISIAGAGHVAMMDRPEEFFKTVKTALQAAKKE